MCEIICITDRKLAEGSFLKQIKSIAEASPKAVILREKDLSEEKYEELAVEVLEICRKEGIMCILHTYHDVAIKHGAHGIHFPLPYLRKFSCAVKGKISVIGASVHSTEEALEAQSLGATYITAGHVFETACKEGAAPRGLPFLENVCKSVFIPVYALGGVSASNAGQCIKVGAAGLCMMSEFMKSNNPAGLVHNVNAKINS